MNSDRYQVLEQFLSVDSDERAKKLLGLSTAGRRELFTLIGAAEFAHLIEDLEPVTSAELISGLSSDDMVDVLGELEPGHREKLLIQLPVPMQARARRLLKYGKETAGGRMAEEFIALPEGLTLDQAIARLREMSISTENAFYVYVTGKEGELKGVVPFRELVVKERSLPIEDIMRRDIVTVGPTTDQEEAARHFQQNRLLALPVVDDGRKLLGVITIDDIAAVIQQETSEDMLKLSGASQDEKSFRQPVKQLLLKRLPWLVLTLCLSMLAVSVIAWFESTIQGVIALSVLLPVISAMGGNTGIQTLSLMIRALATGEATFVQFWVVFRREALIGLLNGIVLAVIFGGATWLWKGSLFLGVVAAGAIFLNTCIAGLTGALLPLVLHKLKLDPASSAGPILTTVTDFCGFLLTLKLASWLLPPSPL